MDDGQGKSIVVKEEAMDEMNAAVGQDVTSSQFNKQEPMEMAVKQEPDESINEMSSKNERKRRHASSSTSAISTDETTDDGQEDVMICKDIIRVPRWKKNKPNNEEMKEESIEPSSESVALENPASSIDQQGSDIVKIIEHQKVLKSLSQLLGFSEVGKQPIKCIFTKYAQLVLRGSVSYETTHTGDGYSVTVKTRRTKKPTNTVRGIGNGHSLEEAKINAIKDALVKLFPNILFDASKSNRILHVDNFEPNDEEINEESIEPSSESATLENPLSIDHQDPDIAKIFKHEKVMKSLSQLLGFSKVRSIRYTFAKYAQHILHSNVFYETTDTGDGYSVTVSTRHDTTGENTVSGIGNGHSLEEAKINAVKDALVKLFPNILFDASKPNRILRVDNSMKRRLSGIASESAGPSGNHGQDAINVKVEKMACLPSKIQQEQYASLSASTISDNETMDDGQEDVMICKEIIRVPRSKKNKPNNEEIKEESIEPLSESGALENRASPIDQQDPDIAKIIEHEKALKSLSKLLGFKKTVGGHGIRHTFTIYAQRVLHGSVFYDKTDTDDGFLATVNSRHDTTGENTVCGIGNGHSMEDAKTNAVKDAMVKFFPNILFDASKPCILRIDGPMKHRLLDVGEKMDDKPQANPGKAKRRRNRNRPMRMTGPTC